MMFISLNSMVMLCLNRYDICSCVDMKTLHCSTLPFTKLLFVTDTVVAAAGFDHNLHLLAKKGQEW